MMMMIAAAIGCYGQQPSPADTPQRAVQAGGTSCPIQRVVLTRWQDQQVNIEAGGSPFRYQRYQNQPINVVTAPILRDTRWQTATATYDWDDAGSHETVTGCNGSPIDIIRYRGRHVRFDVAEVDANTLYTEMANNSTWVGDWRYESYWNLFSGTATNNMNTFMTYGVFAPQGDWQWQLTLTRPTVYFRISSTMMPDSGLQIGRIIADTTTAMRFQAWGRVLDQYYNQSFYENWNCGYINLGVGPNSPARQISWRDREFLADYEVSCLSGSATAIMPRNNPWYAQQAARGQVALSNGWSTISTGQQAVIGVDNNGCAVCRLQ